MYGLLWVKFTMHVKVWILISDFHIRKWQKISIKWYETQFAGYIYKWLRWTLKRQGSKKGQILPIKTEMKQGMSCSKVAYPPAHMQMDMHCYKRHVFCTSCYNLHKYSYGHVSILTKYQFENNFMAMSHNCATRKKKMATLTAWFISSQTEEISFFAIIFPKRPRMGVTGESIPCFLTGILRISAICMHTPCCKVRDNFHFQTRKTLFTVLCGTCNSQFKINAEKQTKRQIIKQNWDGLHLIT